MKSLNKLRLVRRYLIKARMLYFRKFWHMDIHPKARISLKARLDRTFPRGIHIAEHSSVAFNATILAHDYTRGIHVHTYIERNCFIGANSIILPGIRIGEGSVVGAGAVVTKDVPPHSAVAGNPARIIRSDIEVGKYGRFVTADEKEQELRKAGDWE